MTTTSHLLPLGMLTILYPGYDAAQAFTRPDLVEVIRVTLSRTAPLSLPHPPTGDTYEVAVWLTDNEIEIMSATRVGTAKDGRAWRGRYNLVIGASRDTLDWLATRQQ